MKLGAVCAVVASAWAVALVVIAGLHRPGYSHISQFISELGEHGTRDGWRVSWLGFFAVGALALAAVVLMQPGVRVTRLVALGVLLVGVFTFVGYAGSAVWRCDVGCPETGGSRSQDMHYLVSTLDILGVIAGLACVAIGLRGRAQWRGFQRFSLAAAVYLAVVGPFLLGTAVEDVRGLVQRSMEAVVFAWFVVVALMVTRGPDRVTQP